MTQSVVENDLNHERGSIIRQQCKDIAIGMGIATLIQTTQLTVQHGANPQIAIDWFEKATNEGSVFADALLAYAIFSRDITDETGAAAYEKLKNVQENHIDTLTPYRQCVLYHVLGIICTCFEERELPNHWDKAHEYLTLASSYTFPLTEIAKIHHHPLRKGSDGHWYHLTATY